MIPGVRLFLEKQATHLPARPRRPEVNERRRPFRATMTTRPWMSRVCRRPGSCRGRLSPLVMKRSSEIRPTTRWAVNFPDFRDGPVEKRTISPIPGGPQDPCFTISRSPGRRKGNMLYPRNRKTTRSRSRGLSVGSPNNRPPPPSRVKGAARSRRLFFTC